ncbi:TetR family transcriptional regulator [Frankia sp. CcI49]|uniref:DNA-binding transcriptional regulator, AcrR family n=1 Tax=Parafrankia irregularis TaxID=795642 RepID=A0A0S4QEJ5_9ACTN|nr:MULTISPECIES: TetR/AcrR family transcriptional regulator [Frankiaceae]KPM54868.1 transcriptional regulator [Frankia sp. R43]MBE3199458.1 TetR/AcrR family transcriptional regulator [Parafrankia sp. CH37]ONH61065.1 TetR family transcriptional regulator [Frankia sp. CcI49]CUU53879.1 DNA-binding transcriptional regulator, AcrR family [Parafrankia irregularis]
MKSRVTRGYQQRQRSEAAAANTERILAAGAELFTRHPFDQVTLAMVAEHAEVGVQTVIRRFGTKDGLVRAISAWMAPQIEATRGIPDVSDPAVVAERLARHYERWGDVTDRAIRQQDASPALAEVAEAGRRAHRDWTATAFAAELEGLAPDRRHDLLGRLAAVCGVELWLVLRRDQAMSVEATRHAVADLIAACLRSP